MFAKVTSLGVTGLAGYAVQVEADLSGGLPQFTLVGLPDSAVKESSERVRSAVKNLKYPWPVSRITINLAPADVRWLSACWRRRAFCLYRGRSGPFWGNWGWTAPCARSPGCCPWP